MTGCSSDIVVSLGQILALPFALERRSESPHVLGSCPHAARTATYVERQPVWAEDYSKDAIPQISSSHITDPAEALN